jgi:hypothetical protein
MLFRVVLMFKEGIRIPADTLRTATPTVGRLVIDDWREGNAERRALRVARLKHPTICYSPELLHPLFDPTVIRCDKRGMVLIGFENHAQPDCRVVQVVQQWWLRQVEAPEKRG